MATVRSAITRPTHSCMDHHPRAPLDVLQTDLFREYCERAVPDALGDAIDQIKDEWDGSPFLLLAIPGHENLDAFLMTSTGADRLASIVEAFRFGEALPAAASIAFSMPLFTPPGPRPEEGMLLVTSAHDSGATRHDYWRLRFDEADTAVVDALPNGVVGETLPSATADLLRDLVVLCGQIEAGREDEDSDRWDELLAEAQARIAGAAG
jgi:hypothetical protein